MGIKDGGADMLEKLQRHATNAGVRCQPIQRIDIPSNMACRFVLSLFLHDIVNSTLGFRLGDVYPQLQDTSSDIRQSSRGWMILWLHAVGPRRVHLGAVWFHGFAV